jgi:hypothetical protein
MECSIHNWNQQSKMNTLAKFHLNPFYTQYFVSLQSCGKKNPASNHHYLSPHGVSFFGRRRPPLQATRGATSAPHGPYGHPHFNWVVHIILPSFPIYPNSSFNVKRQSQQTWWNNLHLSFQQQTINQITTSSNDILFSSFLRKSMKPTQNTNTISFYIVEGFASRHRRRRFLPSHLG